MKNKFEEFLVKARIVSDCKYFKNNSDCWKEGFLIVRETGWTDKPYEYQLLEINSDEHINYSNNDLIKTGWWDIYSETIRRYANIKDISGEKIFEGYKVLVKSGKATDNYEFKGIVVFDGYGFYIGEKFIGNLIDDNCSFKILDRKENILEI